MNEENENQVQEVPGGQNLVSEQSQLSAGSVAEVPQEDSIEETAQEQIPAMATITSLVQSLHQAIDDARTIVLKYQQRSNILDQREKDVLFREVTVDSRSKDLAGRESECAKVENIQKLAKDAQAFHDSASLRLNAAVEAERSLARAKSEHDSKTSEDRKQTQMEANNVLKQRSAIDAEVNKRVNAFLVSNGFKKEDVAA